MGKEKKRKSENFCVICGRYTDDKRILADSWDNQFFFCNNCQKVWCTVCMGSILEKGPKKTFKLGRKRMVRCPDCDQIVPMDRLPKNLLFKQKLNDFRIKSEELDIVNLENSLKIFEKKIRSLIVNIFSENQLDWWSCLSPTIKEETLYNLNRQKKRDEKLGDFGNKYEKIEFLNFSRYIEIITSKKFWRFFEKIFKDKNQIQQYFIEISDIRNSISHHRYIIDTKKIIGLKYFERISSLIENWEKTKI